MMLILQGCAKCRVRVHTPFGVSDMNCHHEKIVRHYDNKKSIRLTIFIPFTLVIYVLSVVMIVFS